MAGHNVQSFGYRLHGRAEPPCKRAIELDGIPQIPKDVFELIERGGEWALSGEQIERSNAVIWGQATKVIQSRHRFLKECLDD
jgi:hypothetical protein